MTDDLAYASATVLAKLIRDGYVTSMELTEIYQQRMNRFNPLLNAVVYTDWDKALRQARERDNKGEGTGRLHGVPMTVKEAIDISGTPSTWGIEALADNVPRENAASVDRLLAAGAVLMGKTNVPSYVADHQTFNPIYGRTNNPWDLSKTPGGSSGGAAAALAAGLTGLELGSDIAGSLRHPAHCCGIYSHKPTVGLCSPKGHNMPGRHVPLDMCVVGPMARSAEDLGMALSVLAGAEGPSCNAWHLRLPVPHKNSWRNWRIGIYLDDPVAPVDGEVAGAIQNLANFAAAQGAKVIENVFPIKDTYAAYRLFIHLLRSATTAQLSEASNNDNQRMFDRLAEDDASYAADTLRGRTMSHRSWLLANEERWQLASRWEGFFRDYDLLLCPVACGAATAHDMIRAREDRLFKINGQWLPSTNDLFWAGVTGMVYLPSTVAPIGTTRGGLPIGVQIVGPQFGDRLTIAFAQLLERDFTSFTPPPSFHR